MQIIIALCVVLILQGAAAQKPPSIDAGIEQKIIARQHEMDKAWLRHDTATVGRMFAEDYMGVTHTGRVIGKAEILKAVTQNDESATEETEESVKALGDTAVYTALITDHGTRSKTHESYTIRTRVMQVWTLRNGNWQVVAEQETDVKD